MQASTTRQTNGFADASVRVLLADDHEMILDLFSQFLGSLPQFDIKTAPNFDSALEMIRSDDPYDIILLDWNMPGMKGVDSVKRAMQAASGRPVAVITGDASPRLVTEVMGVGAFGVIPKSLGVRSLVNAINTISSGERYLPYSFMARGSDADMQNDRDLSPRELSILKEIAKGNRNKEICADLNLALPTVKMHISSICRKLGAKNRLHATVLARDLGLI